ncbi:MAG: aspartate kinase [Alphaproteobacteria bacterium]|nr:MAG: aspartate kinase [Alphaproteobacteria bacterium]
MERKWVVSKFGGSSVKDAAAMLRCSQIVENNPLIKIVVISATQNTTNQLEFVARAASMGDAETLNSVTTELINKHINIAKELFTSPQILNELEAICGELKALGSEILEARATTPRMMDELYSLGERMSSLLVSDLLRLRIPNKHIIFLDARKIIKTNSEFQRAEPQIDLIAKNAKAEIIPYLNEGTIFVTQGFIGGDLVGNTTTLGREGSDYSAALFGEAIDASLVQIWTDVPGVASSDPRLIENAKFIKELSYDEATALATLGAKVLFPTTLLPTKRKNIPVFVGSSLNPEQGGTLVTKEQSSGFSLKGVSQLVRSEGVLVSFIGTHLDEKENLAKILEKDLGESSFEFSDLTEVSISFQVTVPKMDKVESLKIAHDVLLKFNSTIS